MKYHEKLAVHFSGQPLYEHFQKLNQLSIGTISILAVPTSLNGTLLVDQGYPLYPYLFD